MRATGGFIRTRQRKYISDKLIPFAVGSMRSGSQQTREKGKSGIMTRKENKNAKTVTIARAPASVALEPLEQRTLLSTATVLTPAEVRAAYGFNQVLFNMGRNSVGATG